MKHVELWNRFIEDVYYSFLDDENKSFHSKEHKNAVIAFAYDAEVNNGGHTVFFDCFGDVFSVDDVAEALRTVGGEKFETNFLSASKHIYHDKELGYIDIDENADSDPIEDSNYYKMSPALPDLLEAYIYKNKSTVFN